MNLCILSRDRQILATSIACFALFLMGCPAEVPQPTNDDNGEPVAVSAAPDETPQLKRLIVLTNGNSPFWDAAAAGASNAATELKLQEAGLQVVIDRNDFNIEGQLDKLKQYVGATDVAGVAVSVTDANSRAIPGAMRLLRQQGIQVITIDSDVDRVTARDSRFAYLGTDNVIGGQELGRAAAGLRPNGGKYATFVGLKGAANAVERITGFADGAGKRFQKLEDLADGGDPGVAKTNVRDALNRNADLDTLVGIWSYNTPAIVDNVRDLNIRDKVKVVGFDADPPAIRAMEEGFVDAMVVQNPYQMGYQGVRLLKALVEEDEATINSIVPNFDQRGGDLYDTGLKVVVPDEGSPLSEEMFESKTEFLKLSEFQEWLKKYGLSGS